MSGLPIIEGIVRLKLDEGAYIALIINEERRGFLERIEIAVDGVELGHRFLNESGEYERGELRLTAVQNMILKREETRWTFAIEGDLHD
jgi:hypothetical protein